MRLLFVHNLPPWHPRSGGGQQVNHRIAAAAAAARHDVRVLYLGGPEGAASTPYGIEWVPEHRRLTVNALRMAAAARRLSARWRPEVVHGSAAEAGLLPTALPDGVGVVATSHHPDPPPLPGDWSPLHPLRALDQARAAQAPLLEARLLRGAHRVVAISGWSARTLRARGYLRGDEPVAVVPNPIEDLWLTLGEARREPAHAARVLFAGRLEPAKGVDVLLRALTTTPLAHAELRVAGTGPDERALRALAASLGVELRVAFLGHLSGDQLRSEMAVASVLAQPSRAENYPLVPLEAMAAGVPVVATAVGGVPELIADGRSGLLVRPDDADALAAALTRALADRPLRERLRAGGRARAEEHRAARILERLELEYHLAHELARAVKPAPRRRLSALYRAGYARLTAARAPRASGGAPPERAGRIAVVRPGRLGDLLLTDPLLEALERAHPGSRVELITDAADLVPPWMLDDPRRVHRTVTLRRGGGAWRRPGDPELRASLARLAAEWRSEPPEILLFAVGLDDPVMRWLAATLARLAPGAWKAGLVASGQRARELDRAVEPPPPSAHEIERLLTLAEAVGGSATFRLPHISASGDAARVLPDWDGPTVVLHPGASLPSKQWPLPRWGQVTARLRAEGMRVVVVGGPEERVQLPALGIDFDGPAALDRVGALDLRELARAIGEADAFAGNDSFPFHLAAAARVPAVALVGPGAARWTAYPVPHVTVLRDPVLCSPRDGIECPVYTTCPHGACMQNIRVADVVAALRAGLSAQDGASGRR